MNIALPLPYSNMTGVLKVCNKSKDLIITSKLRENGQEIGVFICILVSLQYVYH